MVTSFPSPFEPVGDTLVFVFDSETPVEAVELGRLFLNLAQDYRKFTRGRTLVVERLETGSLIAYVRDAVEAVRPYLASAEEWAKAGKALLDFATALARLLTRAKEDPESAGLFGKGKKRVGTRSVEALLQIAIDSGSEVTVRHFASGGESLEIQVTPVEAKRVSETAEAMRLAQMSNQRLLLGAEPPLVIPDFQSATFAKALTDHSGTDDAVSADIRMIIRSMVKQLQKKGLTFMVEAIAGDLQAAGRSKLAEAVREEAARH